jgi:hypothetical protein
MLAEMEKNLLIPKGMSIGRFEWPFKANKNAENLRKINKLRKTLSFTLDIYQR